MVACTAEPNARALLSRCNKSYSFIIDPIICTDEDGSLGRLGVVVHVVHVCTTTPISRPPADPGHALAFSLQPTRRTTQLGRSPPADRPIFVGVLCVQRAPSRTCHIHGIKVYIRKSAGARQLVQPPGREDASLEDRGTHLRHSSCFHRPPSLRPASVEPDKPGAHGAPGSSRRLSA